MEEKTPECLKNECNDHYHRRAQRERHARRHQYHYVCIFLLFSDIPVSPLRLAEVKMNTTLHKNLKKTGARAATTRTAGRAGI